MFTAEAIREPTPSHGRTSALTTLVFAAVVVAAVGVADRDRQRADEIDRLHLTQLTDHLNDELTQRLSVHRFLLQSVAGTFNASEWVSRDEFAGLERSLNLPKDFPAAEGIGYLRAVPRNDAAIAAFLKRTRADGLPTFQARPPLSVGRPGSPGRSHAVVDYFRPASRGYVGRSVASEPRWAEAIEHTMRTGEYGSTPPLNSADGGGFVWLLPVYKPGLPTGTEAERRAAVDGWVFAPISAKRLLQDLDCHVAGELSVRVFDTEERSEIVAGVVGGLAEKLDESDGLRHAVVGGRPWSIQTLPTPKFTRTDSHAGQTIALGVLLAGALALLLRNQTTARGNAERLATERTVELASRETELREAVDRTELALKGGGLALWDWDLQTDGVYFDRQTAEMLGEPPESLPSKYADWKARVHSADRPRLSAAIECHLEDRSQPCSVEFRVRSSDGSYRWLHLTGHAVQDTADGPLRIVGVHSDITDRVEAAEVSQNESRRAESLARIIAESPNELYIVNQVNLRFEEVNQGALLARQFDRETLMGFTALDLEEGLGAEDFRRRLAGLDEAGVSVVEFQAAYLRPNGSTYPVQVAAQSAFYNQTPVYVLFVTDVTDLRQLESRLAQAQKLESLGQLAAGIAHEINTPMQCVSNNVDFLNDCHEQLFRLIDRFIQVLDGPAIPRDERRRLTKDLVEQVNYARINTNAPAAIADATEASRRVVEIVRAMKTMSHPGERGAESTDVNGLIRNAATISKNRWKYVAELTLDLDADAPEIQGLGAELSQVFLNLIVNAADSIQEKVGDRGPIGRIEVRTRVEAECLRIEVEDTGSGVPLAIRDKLFDQFFTTKEVGKGTGQGLSIAYDVVVNRHHGTLDLQSIEGVGTTFVVRLPRDRPNDSEHGLLATTGRDEAVTAGG